MKIKLRNLALVRWFDNVIMFFIKRTIFVMKLVTVVLIVNAIYYALKFACSTNLNKCSGVAFFIVNIIMLSLSAFLTIKEHKRKNSYMSNFWVITWLFIVVIYLLNIFQQSNISSFLSKKNIDKVFILFFFIMIIAWGIILITAINSKGKTKNIDLTELTIIFSKSVLQSIVSFIALFGLSRSVLSNGLLYFTLITDIYAAYIYPILDMNKYVREKEIEQLKDKNKTNIYFFK